MELAVWFVIATLAVYRLSLLATQEDGPFNLALKWRNLFIQDNWVGRGVRCFWCVSFWMGFLVALALLTTLPLTGVSYLLVALGTSGLAIFIHEQRWRR